MWTGKDLIALGFQPGPHFGKALDRINAGDYTNEQIVDLVRAMEPAPALELKVDPAPCVYNITTDTDFEIANLNAVRRTMDVLLRTPIVEEAAIMPDACPAGSDGTIPVGGVVATRDSIVPGMHSADICCSLLATTFETASPADVLDAIHQATHFGPGGRRPEDQYELGDDLLDKFRANDFLNNGKILNMASGHLGTQGDGNHFAYVGTSEVTGKTVLVTHHGSRGVGAVLFKAGQKEAIKYTKKASPDTVKANVWLPSRSVEGIAYWEALQLVREWTKRNHTVLHDAAVQALGDTVLDRIWNEHNFVFKEERGDHDLFWHAKGATPIHNDFLPDTAGTQILPLNMSEPILFIQGERNDRNRGFAPHGAGRNMSRTAHYKQIGGQSPQEVFERETAGIDARFYSGNIDLSELPSAYKNAQRVQDDMEAFGLANVVDRIMPHGAIMAGDWEKDAPWKRKKAKK